jgi:fucose 4-O-acetylase-like acetyltransferase
MNRIASIDYTKGFAIIMLLLSHCITENGYLKTWIFAWHMPIFFVICGILNTIRYPNGITFNKFSSWFKRRIKQIFIPYFVFGSLYIFFLGGLSFISGEKPIIAEKFVSLLSMNGIVSMWFLPVFFFSELLYVFFIAKTSKIIQYLFILSIILLLLHIQSNGQIITNRPLQLIIKVFSSIEFILIGHVIWILIQKLSSPPPNILLTIILLIASLIALYNGFVSIGSLTFGNVVIFYLAASALSYTIITLFYKLDKHTDLKILNFLKLCGSNSIVILVTNNLLIEIFRLIEYKYLSCFFLNNGLLGSLLMTIILIIPEYALIRCAQGKIGIIFGKVINKT